MKQSEQRGARLAAGYAIAVAVTAAAALLRWALDPFLGETQPFPTFYVAVMLVTLWQGWRPALVAAVLGFVIGDWFFLEPRGSLRIMTLDALAHTLIYFLVTATLIYSIHRSRRAGNQLAAANDSLRESEQRLRATFQKAAVGIMEVDTEGRFVAANDRACQILGYRPGEILGKTVHDITAPEDRPRSDQLNAELVAGRREYIDYEKRYLRRDGSPLWVHVTASAIRDAAGRLLRFIGTVEDISERKQAEAALREQTRLAHLRADAVLALQQPAAMRPLLQSVAALLVERLDAAFARVWTLDQSGQILELQASAGLYTHLDGAHSRVPVGQLKIGRIAQERRPLVTNQVIGDPHVPEQDWARREGLVAFAGFPLMLEGRLLGVVALFARHALSPAAVETFGAVVGVLAQALGRKEAQEALLTEKEFSDTVINSLPGTFYVVDAQNHVRRWNKNLESISGYSAEEIWRLSALEFLAEEDRLAAAQAIAKVFATGEAAAELQFLTKAGRKLPFVFTGKRFDFDGETGFLGVGLDITARKQAEADVAALNQRLAADLADMNRLHEVSTRFLRQGDLQRLLEAILDATITITGAAKGHVQLFNEASGELNIAVHRGYDAAFVEFFSHIRAGTVDCGTVIQSREYVILEDVTLSPLFLTEPRALELMLAAGVRAVVCTPLLAGSGRVVGVLSAHFGARHRPAERDLRLLDLLASQAAEFVERTKAEEALRSAREELARANADLERKVQERTAKLREAVEELEGFSYSIVHDMRAPLRAMQTFASLAQETCAGCVQAEGLDYFRRIRTASNRLDRLITDALNYSKVVREELPVTPVDAGELLRGIVETYPNFQTPTVEIRIEFKALVVLGNESALTQVFSNLLGNAVKFVAPGVKPRVRVWAETVHCPQSTVHCPQSTVHCPRSETTTPSLQRSSTPPPSVRIWFEDNGIGIPKGAHERIFGMFQRMHREEEYPGTGVGLAIVHKAMERIGGRVGVESEPGKGSRFWIELATEESSDLPNRTRHPLTVRERP